MAGFGSLVQQLRSERASLQRQADKLTDAINALAGLESGTGNERKGRRRGPGRTEGAANKAGGRRRKRTMSAEARKRISEAQKKRWAAQRAQTQSGGKKK